MKGFFALRRYLAYVESMAEEKVIDPFVSMEPEVEVDAETSRILQERIKTADEGRVVAAEDARKQIKQWLSRSSTTKTR